jgi:hypothetical protein
MPAAGLLYVPNLPRPRDHRLFIPFIFADPVLSPCLSRPTTGSLAQGDYDPHLLSVQPDHRANAPHRSPRRPDRTLGVAHACRAAARDHHPSHGGPGCAIGWQRLGSRATDVPPACAQGALLSLGRTWPHNPSEHPPQARQNRRTAAPAVAGRNAADEQAGALELLPFCILLFSPHKGIHYYGA